MIKKIILVLLASILLIGCVNAIDSSNWTTANVGYEEFKIPPEYENPYSSDFNMYEYDYDINVFTVRYVNPNIMELYGYFIEHNQFKKVNVSGHDAIHFTAHDRMDNTTNSKLWFSAGEEFYYIAWKGAEITPQIEEVVKSSSPSKYSHDEFYKILNEELDNYKIIDAIESQRYDYPRDNGHHSFVSVGTNGFSYGIIN